MVTHGAGGELHAVADEVILEGIDIERVDLAALCLLEDLQAAVRHGERVVAELQLAGLLADLIHREVDDPAELIALDVHMAGHGGAEHLAQDARGLLGLPLLSGGDADEATGLEAEGGDDLIVLVREELGDAAGEIALLVDLEPIGLLPRLHLNVGAELVDGLAGKAAVGDDDGLDDGAVLERRKLAALDEGGHVLHLEVDAEIGLIRAVALHGLVERNALEGRLGGDIILAELGEDRREHVLKDGEDVVLIGEGHLHIELIEFARAAVAARVLIAEAGGDLEITVEARGH